MGRHIGALRHEAHVAQGAGLGDLAEFAARHFVELARAGGVDHVEQTREAVAEVEAAAATVTDVEDAAHLGFELCLVVEIRIVPLQRMAHRRP